jgi:tetratricopeptide (TPR) repeat protein
MARIYERKGDADLALSCYESALGRVPRDNQKTKSHYLSSKAAFLEKIGRVADSDACYEEALKFAPDDVYLVSCVARTFARKGDVDNALPLFEKAKTLKPDDVPFGYVEFLEQLGQRDKTITLLEQTILYNEKSSSTDDYHIASLAESLMLVIWKSKGSVEGVHEFEKILERHPDSLALRYTYGYLLNAAGRPDEAIEQLHKVLGNGSSTMQYDKLARMQLAYAYFSKREVDKAAEQMKMAVRLSPWEAGIRTNLAGYLRELGRLEDAKIVCSEGLKLIGENTGLRAALACVFRDEGNTTAAIEEAKKAFEMALTNLDATKVQDSTNAFGVYLELLSQRDGFGESLLAVCDLILKRHASHPGKALALSWKAQTYLHMKDYPKAEEAARESLSLADIGPGKIQPMFWLGLSLEFQGHKKDALDAYLKNAEVSPSLSPYHERAVLLMNNRESAQEGVKQTVIWFANLKQEAHLLSTENLDRSLSAFLIFRAIFYTRLHEFREGSKCLTNAAALDVWKSASTADQLKKYVGWLLQAAKEEGDDALVTQCHKVLSP